MNVREQSSARGTVGEARSGGIGALMKFRLVWVGSDDDGDGNPVAHESAGGVPHRQSAGATRYALRGTEMVRCEQLANGRRKVTAVANFTARIVRDLVLDEDAEAGREFGVEAKLGGQRLSFSVSATEFGRMGWVPNKLGPQAIIYPGQQQHARAAIQWLSGVVRQERIFTHTGWHREGTDWVYLQGGGAVGPEGLRCEAQVQLPAALKYFQMRPPADPAARVSAIRASLRFLSVAPDRISFPLLAAVYRSPLGKVDFSLFLAGSSGVFKSALAALCQQHFGAEMDARALPAHFDSTGNALEELAFTAKDALLVVDDFVPTGGPGDGALQSTAERLFRGAGNHQGRSRMSGYGRLRAPRPPRALMLATGEEVPQGQSLRARMLIVELRLAEVDRFVLSECQTLARQGQLAAAMGAFVSWIAERYEELQERLRTRVLELRSRGLPHASHARLPSALAEMQSGWEIWLQFAFEAGAIDAEGQMELARRSNKALGELAALQASYQMTNNMALRFVALLQAALASGLAHVADWQGGVPAAAALWGWRSKTNGRKWIPSGTCIGWVAGSDLYLDASASYQAAQQAAGVDRLIVSEQTLRRRLHEHGLLASIDNGRQTLLVRRTLESFPRHVLHLKASDLVGAIMETDPNRLS
jgi:hypothetical protein